MQKIRLDWPSLVRNFPKSSHSVNVLESGGSDVCAEFADVFSEGLGCISGVEAEIHLQSDASPNAVQLDLFRMPQRCNLMLS